MSSRMAADGSAHADRHQEIVIDRSRTADKWRYRCPRGHTDWDRTNSHIWCRSCRRQADAGDDVNPEWYELLDAKTDETIPWSAVRLIGGEK